MDTNKRPETMERITTVALAEVYIPGDLKRGYEFVSIGGNIFTYIINPQKNESGIYPTELHWVLLKMLWTAAVSAPLFVLITFTGEAAAEFLGLPRFLTRKGGEQR